LKEIGTSTEVLFAIAQPMFLSCSKPFYTAARVNIFNENCIHAFQSVASLNKNRIAKVYWSTFCYEMLHSCN